MAGTSKEEVSVAFQSHESAWLPRSTGPEIAFKALQADQYLLNGRNLHGHAALWGRTLHSKFNHSLRIWLTCSRRSYVESDPR